MGGRKHGAYKTPEHSIWIQLRQRCNNLNCRGYRNYGGRGISVCKEWDSFEQFLKDVGPRPSSKHSIDRIDNNGNYEPNNCRWATRMQQAGNTQKTLIVEYRGEKMIFAAAYRLSNSPVDIVVAWKRFRRGWPLEEALHEPADKNRKKHVSMNAARSFRREAEFA
jgi:hypothetical protein